jgi:hypothetical protein
MYPDYPPRLTPDQREHLITSLKDWSIAHGLAVRPPPVFSADPTGALATTAPVTLFPSPFPRRCFEEAIAIQTAYNELYSAIARDEQWLGEIVEGYDPVLECVVTASSQSASVAPSRSSHLSGFSFTRRLESFA